MSGVSRAEWPERFPVRLRRRGTRLYLIGMDWDEGRYILGDEVNALEFPSIEAAIEWMADNREPEAKWAVVPV